MTDRDIERFAKAMAALNLVYRPEITADQQRVYFRVLADLGIEHVEAAVERVLKTRTYTTPPTPAEIRALAIGSPDERAALAWARVREAARYGLGGYAPITFDDPAIHATVVAMGGWARFYSLGFRDTEPVDLATARKEFLEFYPGFLVRGAPSVTPAALCAKPFASGLRALKVDETVQQLALEKPAEATASPRALPAGKPEWFDVGALVASLAKDHQLRVPARPVLEARPLAELPPLTAEEQADAERKRQALRDQLERLKEID